MSAARAGNFDEPVLFKGCKYLIPNTNYQFKHHPSFPMESHHYSTSSSGPASWTNLSRVIDRKSTFEGRAVAICSRAEAESRLAEIPLLDKRIKKASHTIYAWRVSKGISGHNCEKGSHDSTDTNHKSGSKKNKKGDKSAFPGGKSNDQMESQITGIETDQGFENGGEPPGGEKLLELLQLTGTTNVLVVVHRWYGGVKLGNDRFKHIVGCGQKALEEGHFFIKKKNKK